MRILVIRPGALGDVLLTVPALRALQARFPQAEIDVMGSLDVLRLLLRRSVVGCVSSFDEAGLALLFLPDGRPPPALQERLDQYELIVSYATPTEHPFARNLASSARGRVISLDARPDTIAGVHASGHLQQPLVQLGAQPDQDPPHLELCDADRQDAAQWLGTQGVDDRRLAVVHAGSGSPSKNWSAERFVALGQALTERHDLSVLWLAGPADEQIAGRVQEALGDATTAWLRNAPLPLVAAVLERCALYVGNDSGVSHLAAAVGAPSVVIFGPTDARVWAPRGANVLVLTGEAPCAPCTSERSRSCVWTRCLDSVTVAAVLDTAEQLLQGAMSRP